MAAVFLSYAAEDRDRVASLVGELERSGFSVWWDRRIGVGSSFDSEIERELDAASCVVVVWSNASVESHWVREEALEAQGRGILVPVQIDDCRLPLGFRRAQTASLVGWPGRRGDLQPVMSRVRELVGERAPQKSQSASPTADEPSIAVLPFANMSPDPDNVYFSDGVAEEILNGLTKLTGIKVIARTSSFRFREDRDIREIGELLGVTHVLEGSVRKAANRVRITAQLIHAANGVHLWSESYSRDLEDVFEVQEEIARTILGELEVTLLDTPRTLRRAVEPAAYDAYLLGHYHQTRWDAEQAIASYEKAISLEPDFADALGALSRVHHLRQWSELDVRPVTEAVRRYGTRALEVDPNQPDALAVHATQLFFVDRAYQASIDVFHDLLARFPNHEAVVSNAKNPLVAIGRFDLSLRLGERLVELDPLSAFAYSQLAMQFMWVGRLVDAEAAQLRVSELSGTLHPSLIDIALRQGDLGKAREYLQRLGAEAGTASPLYLAGWKSVRHAEGDSEEAKRIAERLREMTRADYVPPFILPEAALVVDEESWVEIARKAIVAGHFGALNFLRGAAAVPAPDGNDVADDPAYQALLRSVGLDDASVETLIVPDLPF